MVCKYLCSAITIRFVITIDLAAGVDEMRVVNCHGSFAGASCLHCGKAVEDIEKGF